jgi:hypothetical protein
VDELARKRADLAGDGRLWSPTDALEDTIERIKTAPGEVLMMIHWWEI